jgi:hypothetical protein
LPEKSEILETDKKVMHKRNFHSSKYIHWLEKSFKALIHRKRFLAMMSDQEKKGTEYKSSENEI